MSTPICEIPKNSKETIQLSLEIYHGHKLASLRVYYQQEGKGMIPTKKGISIPISLWPQIKAGLVKMEEAIITAGRLDEADLEPKG